MAQLLIVDDDSQNSQALTSLLSGQGHEVVSAADAGAALGCLNRNAPDLILLDLGLPRVQGLDLLEALRAEPRYAGIPVAVYTDRDEPDVRDAARRLGACDFIAKGQLADDVEQSGTREGTTCRRGFRVAERTDGASNEARRPDLRLEWSR